MKLIVGNMSNLMKDFIKQNQFSEHIMVINKMCNVKTIYESVDIIIPFGIIEKNGLITGTKVHLAELLMSVDAKRILYGNELAKEEIDRLSIEFNVPNEKINTFVKTRNRVL